MATILSRPQWVKLSLNIPVDNALRGFHQLTLMTAYMSQLLRAVKNPDNMFVLDWDLLDVVQLLDETWFTRMQAIVKPDLRLLYL